MTYKISSNSAHGKRSYLDFSLDGLIGAANNEVVITSDKALTLSE